MRLREAAVLGGTIADILWHGKPPMSQHQSVAQIVEIRSALEKIEDDMGRWNKSLAMLGREPREVGVMPAPQSPPAKKNGLGAEASNPLI